MSRSMGFRPCGTGPSVKREAWAPWPMASSLQPPACTPSDQRRATHPPVSRFYASTHLRFYRPPSGPGPWPHFSLAPPPSSADNTPNEPRPQNASRRASRTRDVRNRKTATTREDTNRTGDCPSRSLHEPQTNPLGKRPSHRSTERQTRKWGTSP